MVRPPIAERMVEPRRGPWTPEEDIMLVSYIQEHCSGKWRLVAQNAGFQRGGKSCSLRWMNYLRPDIKRETFTPEEDQIVIRLHALLGNRWAAIARHLPTRTDNDIRNYWHTHLKEKLGKVYSSGVERAKNYGDNKHNGDAATTGGLDYMYQNETAGNSITPPPQNDQEWKSMYHDNGIPPLTVIEKWLLDDPSSPFPQVPPAPAPAPDSDVRIIPTSSTCLLLLVMIKFLSAHFTDHLIGKSGC